MKKILVLVLLIVVSFVYSQPTEEQQQKEVERFIKHKVRRKENLFSISQRYGITIDDIKRYNTQLYNRPLKKRMRLRIPRFKKKTNVVFSEKPGIKTRTHIVQPKETIWGLAHQNHITIEEFKKLNPQLREILRIGDTIRLPEVQKIIIKQPKQHLVKLHETIYGLSKKYKISREELIRLNPSLKAGLKAGTLLNLPESPPENFVYYEVKAKETRYSLEKKLNVSEKILDSLNPSLKAGLKAGMVLKLPKPTAEQEKLELIDNLLIEKFNIFDSIPKNQHVKLAFMIPFRFDSIQLDSLESTAQQLQGRNLYTVAADFYAGAKIAMQLASEKGISINAKVFDTENSISKINQIISKDSLSSYDAVIGPLIPNNATQLAARLAPTNTPVIYPLSARKIRNYQNVFQATPTEAMLRKHMLNFIKQNGKDKNILIVSDSVNTIHKAKILQLFPNAAVAKVTQDSYITKPDIDLQIKNFTHNWVILETNNPELITSVTSVVNSRLSDSLKITLLTTYKGAAYDNENISNSYLSALNFHYPSDEYPKDNPLIGDFKQAFLTAYGAVPNRDATRAYDVTLDVILKLAYNKNLYQASQLLPSLRLYGSKFQYKKQENGGYQNQGIFIVKHQDLALKEVEYISSEVEE